MWRRMHRHRPKVNRSFGAQFQHPHGFPSLLLGAQSSLRAPFGRTGLNPNLPPVGFPFPRCRDLALSSIEAFHVSFTRLPSCLNFSFTSPLRVILTSPPAASMPIVWP